MRRAWWPFWVVLAFDLLISITPLLPFTAFIWQAATPDQFYRALTVLIGLCFTTMTAAVAAVLIQETEKLTKPVDRLANSYPVMPVKRLRDDHFYPHFLSSAKMARHTALISYFAPYPPTEETHLDRKAYYRDILSVIRASPNVQFKRLVRDAPSNRAWVTELLQTLRGQSNFHLAILRDELPAEKLMGLALAVQIIDNEKTWLVAVSSHERQGEYRDVYIENPIVAEALASYFNRLWMESDEIMRAGTITAKGRDLLNLTKGTGG